MGAANPLRFCDAIPLNTDTLSIIQPLCGWGDSMEGIMFEKEVNYITVDTSLDAEIPADHAHVYLKITGSSAFTGSILAKRAAEVESLQERLSAIGIPEEAFEVTSVLASVQKGGPIKTSTVTYQIRVLVEDLKLLPRIAGIIPETKHVTLQSIEWGYHRLPEVRLEWLRNCLAASKTKAAVVADGLALRLGGVYRCSEKLEERDNMRFEPMIFHRMSYSLSGPETLEAQEIPILLRNTRRVTLRVTVSYLVESAG
jgi:uncharacterized protein YggE